MQGDGSAHAPGDLGLFGSRCRQRLARDIEERQHGSGVLAEAERVLDRPEGPGDRVIGLVLRAEQRVGGHADAVEAHAAVQ
jgi:hypothetical protein